MTDVQLNAVALSTACPEALVIRVRRPLVGNRRDSFVEVPGRDSAWTFTEQPGDRRLSIELDLQGLSFAARRDAVVALADWADTLAGPVELIVDDQPDRYWSAVLESAPDADEWLTAATVTLDYRVGPYALSTTLSTESFTGADPLSDTFTTPDAVLSFPVLEITPHGGSMTGFSITLNTDTLTVAETFADGQTVTVNAVGAVVTIGPNDDTELTGVWDGADLRLQYVSGDFGVVLPGLNSFDLQITGAATTVDLDITWRRRFR